MIHPGENVHMTCDRAGCPATLDLSRSWVTHASTLGEAVAWAESQGWRATPLTPRRHFCPDHTRAPAAAGVSEVAK